MNILKAFFVFLLILAATFPALNVGFLADDFYMGDRIVRAESANPGLWAAVRDAFVLQWTDSFDVFRPLTILSLRLDYWMFGADAAMHHVQNLFLWVLFAFSVGSTVSLFLKVPTPHVSLLVTALIGVWPAGIESIGWLVAREDLFCAIFAVLGLRALARQKPLLQAIAVGLALCSKETAVVLPPLLLLTGILIGKDLNPESTSSTKRRLLLQHAATWAVLIIYFALRIILFGSIGGRYNQDSYFSYLGTDGAIVRTLKDVASSLLVLLTPVNRDAYTRVFNWPASLPYVLTLAPLGALLLMGLKMPSWRGVRLTLVILAWLTAPLLLLCVPLGAVYQNLEKSRMLVLPMIPWAMGIAWVYNSAWNRWRSAAALMVAALLIIGMLAFHLGFTSYRRATDRVDVLLSDIREHTHPGSRTLILNGEHPKFLVGVHPSLTFLEGCHVLSAGLFHATRAPFEPSPGRHLEPVSPAQFPDLLSILGDGARLSRPNILRVHYSANGPRIVPLAKAGHFGTPPRVLPEHASRITPSWPTRFEIELTPHLAKSFGHGSIHIFEPGGARGIAQFRIGDSEVKVTQASVPSLKIDGPTFELVSTDGTFRSPLTKEVLLHLPHRVFLWWIELRSQDDLLLRTPYALVFIDPES
jgi:hypothetical protein